MNTASLELSKELYELSGWSDTYFVYNFWHPDTWSFMPREQIKGGYNIPAYDLGFLLRKLPNYVTIYRQNSKWWSWDITEKHKLAWNSVDASTPEDCACKLAIELIKQGILPAAPKQTKEEK